MNAPANIDMNIDQDELMADLKKLAQDHQPIIPLVPARPFPLPKPEHIVPARYTEWSYEVDSFKREYMTTFEVRPEHLKTIREERDRLIEEKIRGRALTGIWTDEFFDIPASNTAPAEPPRDEREDIAGWGEFG